MRKRKGLTKKSLPLLFSFFALAASAQNSPYSRYGLGDEVPTTNILTRGMGGISAGIVDITSVNYANPASFSKFQALIEERSKKMASGRVVLDVGINFDNRTIRTPNTPQRFTSNNTYFSYVQVGLPLRRNWGLSFGIRPLTRIDYRIVRREMLKDPETGSNIDSAQTEFSGNGGSFLPSIGTGFSIGGLSLGANVGYLFGRKELSTRRVLFGQSEYSASNHTVRAFFGDLYFDAGMQYQIKLGPQSVLRLGASGNWKQDLGASVDSLRETYVRASTGEDVRIDSVYERTNVRGAITYPSSYTIGFAVDRTPTAQRRGYVAGVDLVQKKWDEYRFFGTPDAVSNSWEVRVGAQTAPSLDPNKVRYAQAITYRAGFFVGRDYINVGKELPEFGISAGLGLPMRQSRLSPGQFTQINLALEYGRRGNNENVVKENTFRIAVGLNLTDLWFGKRRYE